VHDPTLEPSNTLIFSFVRHPINFLESFWAARHKLPAHHLHLPPDFDAAQESVKASILTRLRIDAHLSLCFQEFIKAVTEKESGVVNEFFSVYVGTVGNEIGFIGRHENLQTDLTKVMHITGTIPRGKTITYDHKPNMSNKAEVIWTPELKQAVLESEAECINRFYPSLSSEY
jgi:hypothetical protein